MYRAIIIEKDPLIERLLILMLEKSNRIRRVPMEEKKADLLIAGVCDAHQLTRLLRRYPGARLVLISHRPAPACIRLAKEVQADGLYYLAPDEQRFLTFLEEVLSGKRMIPESPPVCRLGNADSTDLTRREIAVLEMVTAGETDSAIAEKLYISVRTVKSHIQSIREKTGFRNRTELGVQAGICGLVIPGI